MAFVYNLLVEVLHGTDDSDLMVSAGHNKVMLGHRGNDYMAGFQSADVEAGGFGNDTVIGWAGADMLFGNEGSDIVIGNYDPDLLIGGKDNDTLIGGKDNDTLYGNQGINELLGGTGADIFAMVPSVRHEHEEIPVNVLVGFHEETVVTITTETVDPPPHDEEVTVREDAPGQPDRGSSQAAWDNYAQRSIANGYTLVEYAPDDPQQMFPTYYREETRTITVDPPPHTIEGRSASARAGRRGWRRRSPPSGRRWRNRPASACRSNGPSACRSNGPGVSRTSATRLWRSASARAGRCGWRRRSPPFAARRAPGRRYEAYGQQGLSATERPDRSLARPERVSSRNIGPRDHHKDE
jgi:RTX calcium-binding nonapeptide repeat (4 copies)